MSLHHCQPPPPQDNSGVVYWQTFTNYFNGSFCSSYFQYLTSSASRSCGYKSFKHIIVLIIYVLIPKFATAHEASSCNRSSPVLSTLNSDGSRFASRTDCHRELHHCHSPLPPLPARKSAAIVCSILNLNSLITITPISKWNWRLTSLLRLFV